VVLLDIGENYTATYELVAPQGSGASPPVISTPFISSKLKLPEYMDDLYVTSQQLNIGFNTVTELHSASLTVAGNTYEFTDVQAGKYSMDIFAPLEPGKHIIKFNAVDVFGGERNFSESIKVTDTYYPEIYAYHDGSDLGSFPAYVTQRGPLVAGLYYDRVLQESDTTFTKGNSSFGFNLTNQGEGQKIFRYELEGLADGEYTLTISGGSSYQPQNSLFILLPVPPYVFVVHHLSGLGFVIYHLFLVAMIMGSLVMLLAKDLVPTIKKIIRPKTVQVGQRIRLPKIASLSSRNSFILLISIFSATIFASVATVIFTTLVGTDFGEAPSLSGGSPLWYSFYALANASVLEELVSRLLLIGIPLVIYEVISRGVFKQKCNKILNCFIGGDLKIEGKDIYLIIFSSVLFGLGHLGWSPWKVVPTFLAGVAFAYLFYKKGLHMAILLHFATDYLGMSLQGEIGGVTALVALMVILGMLGMMFFGFFYAIQYTRDMLAFVFKIKKRPSETIILSGVFLALLLDVLVILYFAYLGSNAAPDDAVRYYAIAIFLVVGLILITGGCFFALLKWKVPAFVLLLAGAFFSLPIAFVSVLACVAAYDLYIKIRLDGPFWVLKAYKNPTVLRSPSKRTP